MLHSGAHRTRETRQEPQVCVRQHPDGVSVGDDFSPIRFAGLRILVVGINYSPEHAGIAPYTTQACEYLHAKGADVVVLTGVPHYPQWTTPSTYKRRLRVDQVHGGVEVRRLRHFVPAEQTVVKRTAYEFTFGLHVLLSRLPWHPDVVLTVIPSLCGAAAAAAIARRHRAAFVVWLHDLMGPATSQSGIASGARISAGTTWLEGHVLRQADSVLVLNDAFSDYVKGLGVEGDSISVVRNWSHVSPPQGDRRETRFRLGWREDHIVVLHSGNMGLKQGLETVVEAAILAANRAAHVRFVLMGEGNQRRRLQQIAADVRTIEFLPPAPDEEYTDILAAADVLLVNERASALDMSLPSKLTSYFRAGVPVIAAVPALGGTAREVERSRAGEVVTPDDPSALLDAVLTLTADKDTMAGFRHAAKVHVREHLSADASLTCLADALWPTATNGKGKNQCR